MPSAVSPSIFQLPSRFHPITARIKIFVSSLRLGLNEQLPYIGRRCRVGVRTGLAFNRRGREAQPNADTTSVWGSCITEILYGPRQGEEGRERLQLPRLQRKLLAFNGVSCMSGARAQPRHSGKHGARAGTERSKVAGYRESSAAAFPPC